MRLARWLCAGSLWSLIVLSSIGGATADVSEASKLYEQGTTAHEKGEYLKAAQLFARADELVPDPAALQAALSSVLLADDPVLAMRLAARSARVRDNEALTETAAAVHKRFVARAGRITVRCHPCRVSIDGHQIPASQTYWATVGEHKVVIEFGGQSQHRSVRVKGGETVSVVPILVEPPSPTPERNGISPAWFWVGVGVSALFTGATIASAVDTANQYAGFEAQPTDSAARSGQSAQIRTNVLFGSSIGLGAITTTLGLFADWSSESVATVILPDGGILSVETRF